MKALIVYDTFFGNTEKVAQAMGEALGAVGEAQVVRVSEVSPEQISGVNLLIVGSPTRAFRPTSATVSFLRALPADTLKGIRVAAFDTRTIMDEKVPAILRFMARIFGYAAKPIAARLQKKGGMLVASPEGFFVTGTEGPLAGGELERAAAWAKKMAG